ncbi:kinase suppressor of Ras 1 [Anopheles cruzii]|uniref:kinase suppressor of Ras 1 n=1 Tax=Anopheles cruzii TaxID=68878 RepID=UPI0022EC593F|nr:kinase suppressor of Ras 1 [Anopheles cruzii]
MMMMANNNSGEAKGGSSAGNAQPNEGGAGGGGDESGSDGGGGGAGGSANASTGDSEVNIRRGLDVIQSMIDISADRLEGLRTQCATSAELTQQEIRTLETKLVKLFSDLLITKSKLPERLPARGLPATGNELKQWLRVVGLSCASLNAVIQQVSTLEGLLEKDDKELRTIMGNNVYVREEEIKRLTRASGNLKRYREQLEAVAGGRKVNAGDAMHDLFWDSWDRQPACHRTSPRVNRSLAGAKCNKPNVSYRHNNGPPTVPMAAGGGEFHADHHHITSPQSEESMASQHHHHHQQHHHQQHHHYHQQQHHEQLLNPHHTISPDEASTSGCTPSPSPPNSPSSVMLHGKQQQQQQQNRKGFPTTPPPKRKHQTALLTSSSSSSASSASTVTGTATVTTTQSAGAVAACAGGTNPADAASAAALTKSKSHESQFGGGGGGGAAGANNNHAVNNNNNNNNNNNGSSAGPGGGNNNPLYLVNNNNNIPTNVVPLGSNHEAGGPVVVSSATTTTTTTGSNILSEGAALMAANQRPMGNGSAGQRMGTFPRSRLHTEPTITSSNTTGSPSGGTTTQPDHLPQPQHHHHHHPHHHHHLHHGAPHHHPPSYHHHLQQQVTGGGQSDGGEYGASDGPPIIGSVPPKSPCTPIITRGMGHMIQHRFTKKFKVTKSTCDLCNKQMFFGYKCTECKYRCHRDCMQNVPPSCGLPQEFVDEFKKSLQSDTLLPTSVSPNIGRPPGGGTIPGGGGMMYVANARAGTLVRGPMHAIHACGGPDSSSAGSSCNSSSPSSPALLSLPPQTPGTSRQFNFPEVPNGQGVPGGGMMASTISTTGGSSLIASSGGCSLGSGITIETHPIGGSTGGGSHAVRSVGSSGYGGDSGVGGAIEIPTLQFSDIPDRDGACVLGGETDKTGSASATSTDSSSDRTPIRLDSTEERDHESSWPRQNSLSLKEWDIPYDDLHLKEKIGNGRFGTVHRALWHGDVAVKLLKEDYVDNDRTLEAFKLEVATFKKTRHENVVLFMGACMQPPRLAIVTSLCKGNTLFTHIHLRKDKFNLNRTTLVAQQISQGMGYLHARGIVHKDLKTKNIFLENGKVIITDFGLFSATKLLYCELGLGIPSGWLCYLAPELMCNLTPYRPVEGDLPFSRASDIYAFGTVWYELLCGEFPFKSQPAESIIWQVGRGMKQTLANLQASRDVKDILIKCWNYHLDDRPDFAKLLNLLERLPKKRLARSPSHPVQLSRSAESVF